MRRKIPSPAMIIGLVALFAALGGTSYAFAASGSSQYVWTGWNGANYPAGVRPHMDGHIAKFSFTSPVAGFVDVTAHFGVRVLNVAGSDCHVQNQIGGAPGTPSPAPGFMDNWINGNLPTQQGAGTYLQLDESVSRVLHIVRGHNTVYLNGTSDCADTVWGPINLTALYVRSNPPATLSVS